MNLYLYRVLAVNLETERFILQSRFRNISTRFYFVWNQIIFPSKISCGFFYGRLCSRDTITLEFSDQASNYSRMTQKMKFSEISFYRVACKHEAKSFSSLLGKYQACFPVRFIMLKSAFSLFACFFLVVCYILSSERVFLTCLISLQAHMG